MLLWACGRGRATFFPHVGLRDQTQVLSLVANTLTAEPSFCPSAPIPPVCVHAHTCMRSLSFVAVAVYMGELVYKLQVILLAPPPIWSGSTGITQVLLCLASSGSGIQTQVFGLAGQMLYLLSYFPSSVLYPFSLFCLVP